MVKGILSFVSPVACAYRTISLTDETAKKYTENGSEPSESMKMYIGKVSELSESTKMYLGKVSEVSEHFAPVYILKANGRRKRLSATAGHCTA